MAIIPQKVNDEPAIDELLEPGWYSLMIVNTEAKKTKAGDGEYLNVQQIVADGEHKGFTIWNIINWDNPSQAAQKIGIKQWQNLRAVVEETLENEIEDTEDMHGTIVEGLVIVNKSKNPAYSDKNIVKKWRVLQSEVSEEI